MHVPLALSSHQELPRLLGGGYLDDQAREDVVRVVDMRIPLDYVRVAALVADGVQGLSVADHIYLVARPVQELIAPEARRSIVVIATGSCSTGVVALSIRSHQD